MFVLNVALVLLTAIISCGITEIWMGFKKKVRVILIKNNLCNLSDRVGLKIKHQKEKNIVMNKEQKK
jgi:hypothetical protein